MGPSQGYQDFMSDYFENQIHLRQTLKNYDFVHYFSKNYFLQGLETRISINITHWHEML